MQTEQRQLQLEQIRLLLKPDERINCAMLLCDYANGVCDLPRLLRLLDQQCTGFLMRKAQSEAQGRHEQHRREEAKAFEAQGKSLWAYNTLCVSPGAPPEVIRAAYRSLATKYHPDREGGDAERMKEINRAYEQLKNL